jgi:hypothetical protein
MKDRMVAEPPIASSIPETTTARPKPRRTKPDHFVSGYVEPSHKPGQRKQRNHGCYRLPRCGIEIVPMMRMMMTALH